VDPDIAGRRVGTIITQLFAWPWVREDALRLSIVIWIFGVAMLSIVNSAIGSLPDRRQTIRKHWGCQVESDWNGGALTSNVTLIIKNITVARWVKAALKLKNWTLCWVIYFGQLAYCTSGTQMPMCGGLRYLLLDDILPPPAKDMINDIREKSDTDADLRHPHPLRFRAIKIGFPMFSRKLQRRIIR